MSSYSNYKEDEEFKKVPDVLKEFAFEQYLEYKERMGKEMTYSEYVLFKKNERKSFAEFLLRNEDDYK